MHQHWKNRLVLYPNAKQKLEDDYLKNEEYFLSMDDVYGCFYILLFGYIVSLLAFLFEIFYHEFLMQFNFVKKIKNVLRSFASIRTKRVRKIQVRPAEI